MKLVTLATCNLNQWAMDFDGNLKNIIESIKEAKAKGARYRLGPELEVPGYGCEDHFHEEDTYIHSWQCIAEILKTDLTDNILCDIGMPINHQNVKYNCRIFLLNRKVVFIRPKIYLADDGNYRESRWFTSWKKQLAIKDYYLPFNIRKITGQTKVPFGDGAIAALDTVVSSETCEELFTPNSHHIALSLNGVEIIGNGSGSHHQLKKLEQRINLMCSATAKAGGVYMYANQQGCDGGRLYYDGCAAIIVNGEIVAQGGQFSLQDVEVIVATVDLHDIRAFRGGIASRGVQAAESTNVERVDVNFELGKIVTQSLGVKIAEPIEQKSLKVEEEIGYGPACWLWDYLRRSGAGGFFLPLSGGADSSSTAAIVYIMCELVVKEVKKNNKIVIADCQRIVGDPNYMPESAEGLCEKIFFTCYMGSVNSSEETKNRAARLGKQIGSTHLNVTIDEITKSFQTTFAQLSDKIPKFKVHGGTNTENLALQNIQARSRMVLSYYLSQLLLWTRGKPGGLLVLGSANVDEALRGYFTKYDCSSADLNPIGGVSKVDLKKFLRWAGEAKQLPALIDVVEADPTAELEPITESYTQKDEVDMGMTYQELSEFGRLRKVKKCGPYTMFEKLIFKWNHLSPKEVADKVKRFFYYYSINRHKMTILTPSYHAESYSPDDNRFDLRQFLYNSKWTWQFRMIDEFIAETEGAKGGQPEDKE
eukprot:TRINITY_DN17279_c0_g1_i1.p1 TRINITY_DN17279_c0_g1~~TRINITY_DN17279_c0_g1_i1.p1  ORF type:complete len:706 (-),score=170.39 TRINITY_DN17279_c0_g1_i1:44-2161(-)